MTIPNALANTIGSPQKIFRTLVIDGVDVLIRLQKPWEEPPEDIGFAFKIDTDTGVVTPLPLEEEEWMEYGTCLIVEAWSDATQSIMTQGIRRADDQTNDEFTFGVRYMLNHGTDEQWLDILEKKDIQKILKVSCNNRVKFEEPKVPAKKKKKKK